MKKQCISFLFVSALLLIFFSFSCTGISGYDIESNKDKVCESNKLKIVAVIPARYESSRFPGKPLSDICGKPMIWWVYNQAKKVPELNEVYVATDDKRIENVCKQYNINVIMTSKDCKTGTDRVAEVSEKINADLYVNIQGDEPLIEPETILKAIEPFYSDKKLQVSNLMTKIIDPVDVINNTIPKVITNKDGVGIYLTRTTAPYPKGSLNFSYYKQVCVYVFTPEALKFFHNSERGKIEKVEDIEILRFIENGYKVQYVEVDSSSVAVDTQKDLNRVRTLIKEKLKKEDKNNIKILDCTLRDGGYVNDWNFGKENIEGIINKLVDSNADIIECGFFKPHKNYDSNRSVFDNLNRLENINSAKNSKFCVMLNYGDCKIEDIPDYNGEKVDTIRVCFHKKDADNAMNFCRSLKNKGYNVFVQPMSTFRYTDEELKKLIKSANEFLPKAFYMVDSCGVMNKEDVKRMFNIIDESLDPNISIGFHSHNNLQLSFSNAKELLNLNTQRNMIIDSSVFGMGRGSGNLCTELLMQQLNTDCEKKYKLNPIYKIFDEHLNDIYQKTSWGYSMPLFISAKYNCHPNYAIFLKNYNVNINDIDKIISKIEDSKKSVYDGQYIKNLYEEFLNQRQYDCIAFDLDGTLIDSSEGIYNAIRYVEKNLNISKLDEDTLKLCIGPPLKYTYGVLHNLNDELLNKAIILHKKYMSEKGYKECKVYDGVEELLRYLKSIDKKLVVTTLKQENIAKQTLEHLGISKYFDLILGQNTSESLQKTNLLNEVQKVYNTKNIVLVGDSKFDGEAAMKSKANFIALTFGFGFKNLNDANKYKPISTCNSVYELKNVLLK